MLLREEGSLIHGIAAMLLHPQGIESDRGANHTRKDSRQQHHPSQKRERKGIGLSPPKVDPNRHQKDHGEDGHLQRHQLGFDSVFPRDLFVECPNRSLVKPLEQHGRMQRQRIVQFCL